MIEEFHNSELLQELRDDPEKFDSDGKAYDLLQEYFHGKPIETLRPFLKHGNVAARRSAAFVVSELGSQGSGLLLDVVSLIGDEDLHIQWYALESVAVCSANADFEQFVNVVRESENPNSSICRLALRLMANANQSQITACIRSIEKLKPHDIEHHRGLELLLRWNTAGPAEVVALLDSPSNLLKEYGAIVAKKRLSDCPELIRHARVSDTEVISTFAEEALQSEGSKASGEF